MQLEGDDAFPGHFRELVIDRGLAVEFDRDAAADDLHGIVIEVSLLQRFLDYLLRSGFHHPVVCLAVQAAPELVPHVGLRTFDAELRSIKDRAPDLDPTVPRAILDPHLAG